MSRVSLGSVQGVWGAGGGSGIRPWAHPHRCCRLTVHRCCRLTVHAWPPPSTAWSAISAAKVPPSPAVLLSPSHWVPPALNLSPCGPPQPGPPRSIGPPQPLTTSHVPFTTIHKPLNNSQTLKSNPQTLKSNPQTLKINPQTLKEQSTNPKEQSTNPKEQTMSTPWTLT